MKPSGRLTKRKLDMVDSLSITSSQLTSVKELSVLTELRFLDLYKNDLTDVKGLELLPRLENLWLSGNPDITRTYIDKLQKALPNCDITPKFYE